MRSRILAVAACPVLLATAGQALAARGVIAPGAVDPVAKPRLTVGVPYSKLLVRWGQPVGCNIASGCTDTAAGVVFYPRSLSVVKAQDVTSFQVGARSWRTPKGARVGDTAARLVRLYGHRLQRVTDRSRFAGHGVDRAQYWVKSGSLALGFGMTQRHVASILAASSADIPALLARYGPR